MFGKTEEKTNFPEGVYASSSFDAGDAAGGDNSCYKKLTLYSSAKQKTEQS